VWIAGRAVYAYQFHLRLSHSRYGARVWSPRADQLGWHHVHNEGFRRLGGITATVRVDNTKTAVSRGAWAWGELKPSYRRYAKAVRFHIDACALRHPQAKGKVERGIGADRAWREIGERDWSGWDELQAWTDARVERGLFQNRAPVLAVVDVVERGLADAPVADDREDACSFYRGPVLLNRNRQQALCGARTIRATAVD